jgi:hypothetical protein
MEPNVNNYDVYVNLNTMDLLDGSTLEFSVLNVKYVPVVPSYFEADWSEEEAYAVWKMEVAN